MTGLVVRDAVPDDAVAIRDAVVEAFLARPVLDPPSTAPEETDHSVREAILTAGGVVAEVDGEVAGAILYAHEADVVTLRRVATRPAFRHRGVAGAMTAHAEAWAARIGARVVALSARVELPDTIAFWSHRGYVPVGHRGHLLDLAKPAPVVLDLPTAEATRELGGDVARLLRAGDVVVLTGDLGAGKTTLTQGLGAALGARGDITSPTFVIAREHPSTTGGPGLVHVDAYRLGDRVELDDLDLDAAIEDSVTVVEWGEGKAEALSPDRLEIRLERTQGAAGPDADGSGSGSGDGSVSGDGSGSAPGSGGPRRAVVRGVGTRWLDASDALAGLRCRSR